MESLFVATEKTLTMDKFSSQVKISTDVAVKQVLSATAKVVVIDAECKNGVVQASGKIFVEAVFIDASGLVCKAENSTEFIEKQKSSFDLSDIIAKSCVVEQNINLSGTDIVCNVVQEVVISGIYNYEIPKISNENNEFVLDKKEFSMPKLVTVCEDNFVVAEEIEKNLSNVELLTSSASAFLTNCIVENDKVVIEGKILAEVTYNQSNEIYSFANTFDFRQEISAENVSKDMSLNANVILKNIMVTPEIKDDKTTFIFAIDLYSKNYVYENMLYEVANDMFSLKQELQVTYDFIETQNYVSFSLGNESVLSQSDVSSLSDFEDILSVSNVKCRVITIVNEGEKAFATLEICADAYYKTLDSVKSLDVKSQAVIEINKEQNWVLSNLEGLPEISSYKVKAGKDLEIVFKISYLSKFQTFLSEQFVKTFEAVSEKTSNNYGIKVYVSKAGQTLFDLAKVLNVTPEIIASQNDIEDILESGKKIYVYSPVNLA